MRTARTSSAAMSKPLLAVLLCVTGGCAQLNDPAWANMTRGAHQVGVSTGWAFYEANVEAKGTSGVLQPGGVSDVGDDTVDLEPQYGGALKYAYMLTDSFSLGGIIEYRSFDPDPVMPLTAELETEDFQTWHFILSSRYFFRPFLKAPRIRSFVGLDLSWIPEVNFSDVDVTYPASSGIPSEVLSDVTGSDFWTIAPVIGGQYLLSDHLTLDFGAFYEVPLTSSRESLRFENLGGATSDVNVEPEGLIVFIGISWYF